MGRSAEAIKRRAERRGKTEKEQLEVERVNARKKAIKRRRESALKRKDGEDKRKRRRPPQHMLSKKAAPKWSAPQASAETIVRNQVLREAYAKDPLAMTEEDREKAKILVARSERKKAKKARRAMKKKSSPSSLKREHKQEKKKKDAAPVERTPEERARDWNCDKCGNANWGRRDVCNTKS